MQTKNILTTYEKLIPFKRIPYWLYFPALSLIVLIVVEIIFSLISHKNSLISEIVVAIELAILPTFYIWMSKRFQLAALEISPILWNNDKDFQEWLHARIKRIFTLDSFGAKFLVTTMAGGAILTTIAIGLPYKETLPNLFILIGLTAFALVGCQGAYILTDSGITLNEIVRRPIQKTPFFLLPPPAISSLQNLYLSIILTAAFTYTIFSVAAWQSPFGLTSGVIAWLWIGGAFPLGFFFWSSFQFYILIKRIKTEQVKQINEKIQLILNSVEGQISKEQADTIERLMSIQSQVQNLRELPFSLESFFTFLITLILPIVQFVMGFLKP